MAGTDIRVQVRVIAATNRNLEEEVKRGRFREDLYYRLNVMPIVHAVRARAAEKTSRRLISFYVDSYNHEFRKRIQRVAPSAMERLKTYAWPGNVRELRNAVERAMLLAEGEQLTLDRFPILERSADLSESVELPAGGIDLEQLERSLVIQALQRSGWNQTRAATLLGLNRDQIRYRIEKFKLEKPV